ncbi:MAG: class I SAM-dependent methyltransferase [Limisphaerales bacterium]
MKRVFPEDRWPDSWKSSYAYDLEEVYGTVSHRGYAYAYQNRREYLLGLLHGAVPPDSHVLDVAAAQGNFTLTLAERGYRVTWNDLRSELAGYVKLKHEWGEVAFAPGNVFDLEFSHLFDAVLIAEVIEHVAHPDEFLRQIAGLVRAGGHVIVTTPNGAYWRNPLPRFSDFPDPTVFESRQFRPNADGHIFLLHPDELKRLATDAGLELIDLRLFTNPLTAGCLRTEPVLRLLPCPAVFLIERLSQQMPAIIRQRLMTHMGALLRKPCAPGTRHSHAG